MDTVNTAPQTATATFSDTAVSTYEYKPLQIDRSIRILDLQPAATESAPLRASLREVALSDDPDYEAISYAWGAAIFTTAVELPEGTLYITDSLASGLRQFRRPDASRALWADAVCIDQNNNAEKSRQVAQMGSVYRNAARCLIWLGLPSGSEAAAANFMRAYATLSASRERYGIAVTPDGEVIGGWNADIPDDGPVREAIQNIPVDFDWNGADEFYSSPWFQRRWCFQELVLAPEAQVHYGIHHFSWQDFMIAAHIAWRSVMKTKAANLRLPHNFMQTYSLAHARTLFRAGGRLAMFLTLFPSFRCTDDRDHIYSMLGLRASQDIEIWPDYTKPTALVYKQTIRKMYLKDTQESIRLLPHAGLAQRLAPPQRLGHHNTVHENLPDLGEFFKDLPSWVPDWRIDNASFSPFAKGVGPRFFEVSSQFPAWVKPSEEEGCLSIVGVVLGTVTSRKDLGNKTDMHYNEHRDKLVEWKSWFDDQCARMEPFPQVEDPLLIFLRTLTADQNSTTSSSGLQRRLSMNELVSLWNQLKTTSYKDQGPTERFEADGSAPRVVGTANSPTGLIKQYTSLFNFRQMLRQLLDNRQIFTTSEGFFGLGPAVARENDVVVVFAGLHSPFLIRPTAADSSRYYLIGDCYLHGVMYGELQSALQESKDWAWCNLV